MKYLEAAKFGNDYLINKNIQNYKLDVEILASETINKSREHFLLNEKNKFTKKEFKKFNKLLKQRNNRQPLAQIINKKEFWKKNLYIDGNVLIPRPESEHLVEETINLIKDEANYSILDIGCGSGCLIISILLERIKCRGTALDVSKKAIKVSKINAKMQHIQNRIKFIHSDIDKVIVGKYDLIVTNPPYINKHKIKYLDDEVRIFEPKLALDGGIDGLSKIENIILKSSKLIKRGGKLIIEIGFDQKFKVLEILKKNFFYVNKVVKDYSGKDRCIISTKL
jgi:release factor glutamine methyltransferase